MRFQLVVGKDVAYDSPWGFGRSTVMAGFNCPGILLIGKERI